MANLPIKTYKGTSSYLSTITNANGNLLFDTDKKEIFLDDGTNRESYGGGAGDKTYATLAQAKADIANISEKDTVFVKEGTSGSLTQRVDKLEDEVEQINTDLSDQPVLLATIPQGTTSGAEFTTNDNISKYKYILLIGNESLANGTSIIPTNAFVGGFKVGLNNYYGGTTYRLMMEYINDTKVKAFRADSLLTGNCALYGIKC